jgi:hypothetical protein
MHARNRAAQAACYAIVSSLKAANNLYDVEAVVTTSNPSRHADTQYFNRLETLRDHRSGGSINVKSELRCLWCPQGPIAWMWRARQAKQIELYDSYEVLAGVSFLALLQVCSSPLLVGSSICNERLRCTLFSRRCPFLVSCRLLNG